MLIAGVDEAGRGCIIGPLVIVGVLFKSENLPALKQLGVKDSKLLSAKKREFLVPEILKLAERHTVLELTPSQIDAAVNCKRKFHKLNRLEAEAMASVINALQPDEAQIDAADILEERFKHHIQEKLTSKTLVTSKHKADRIFPSVSAASIIAKVTRDDRIMTLAAQYGSLGTGYLADANTKTFLKQWLRNHEDYPDFVRKSWKPAKRIKNEKNSEQRTLI